MGFVIESPQLAAGLDGVLDHVVPFNAYEVRLRRTLFRRSIVWMCARLPIEWLL